MNKIVILIPCLILTQSAVMAQIMLPTPSRIQNVVSEKPLPVKVDCSPDCRTARQKALDTVLPMPAFGVKEALAVLGQRLNYAEAHGWLNEQAIALLNKSFSQLTQSSDNPSDRSYLCSLSSQVYGLNQAFVQSTVLDEQAQPGKEGLMARQMVIRQRLQIARAEGNLNSKKYAELNTTLASITQDLAEAKLDQSQLNKVLNKLESVAKQVVQDKNTGIASRAAILQ